MKFKIILFFFLTTSLLCFSQPDIEWQKSLGGSYVDIAFSIKQTSDGEYIISGKSISNDGDVSGNHGGEDYWIVKMSESGTITWQKSLGGSNGEKASSIHQTIDGGFIVSGQSYSNDGDVTGNHGDADYWIVKLNTEGEIQWQKSLGGSDYDSAYSIEQTTDGGYIISGSSYSNDGDVTGNHGNIDFWIAKLNNTGTLQWQKSLGGSSFETALSIQQTNEGGYIIAGTSNSNDGDVSGNHGDYDFWIVKLNTVGSLQWEKSLGGSNSDRASSIQQVSDGGYIVAGESKSSDGDVSENKGDADYWIVKLNTTGTIQWEKSLGGSEKDVATSIQQTIDGGYVVTGLSSSNNGDISGNHGDSDYWLVKLDVGGNIQWEKSLGGSDFEIAYSVQQTNNGGYIVAGSTSSTDGDVTENHGHGDYWIVKLSPDLGINDNEFNNTAFLYPNPSNRDITIEAEGLEAITIFTSLGKQSYFKEFTGESNANIDVSYLAKGVYTVVISTSSQQLVKKLIIK